MREQSLSNMTCNPLDPCTLWRGCSLALTVCDIAVYHVVMRARSRRALYTTWGAAAALWWPTCWPAAPTTSFTGVSPRHSIPDMKLMCPKSTLMCPVPTSNTHMHLSICTPTHWLIGLAHWPPTCWLAGPTTSFTGVSPRHSILQTHTCMCACVH
jgi:hypothetical protein